MYPSESFLGRWASLRNVQRRSAVQGSKAADDYAALENRVLLAGLPSIIEIALGAFSSNPVSFTNVNNTVFFAAIDGVNGMKLWRSKGTSGGTILIKDIHPGAGGSNPRHTTCRRGASDDRYRR